MPFSTGITIKLLSFFSKRPKCEVDFYTLSFLLKIIRKFSVSNIQFTIYFRDYCLLAVHATLTGT